MAETDSTRSTASGAHSPDDDASPVRRPDARAAAAVPDDAPASGVSQRHSLPQRETATLPDATLPDATLTGDEDPEGRSGPEDGDRAGRTGPETRRMPVAQAGPQDGAHSGGGHAAGSPDSPAGGDSPAADAGERAAADAGERAAADAGGQAAGNRGGAHVVGAGSHPDAEPEDAAAGDTDREAARRAAVRDQAAAAKPALPRFLQVVVALFFPVIVVAAAVRAVATSSFLWLEYHRPGFPADQYGFSLDDRMTYGSYALDYVLNFAPPRYLGGLVTPEGAPLFLESEVAHMADVKGVLGLSFLVALVLFVVAVLACTYLARRYKGGVRRALFSGAVLTLVGIAVLTVLAALAWETFFTQVHALFFADGTWTFRIDDTLIRLFPEQFWTDSAVMIAVIVLAATALTLILTWPTRARRERSMLAQEAAQARYREALDAS